MTWALAVALTLAVIALVVGPYQRQSRSLAAGPLDKADPDAVRHEVDQLLSQWYCAYCGGKMDRLDQYLCPHCGHDARQGGASV